MIFEIVFKEETKHVAHVIANSAYEAREKFKNKEDYMYMQEDGQFNSNPPVTIMSMKRVKVDA